MIVRAAVVAAVAMIASFTLIASAPSTASAETSTPCTGTRIEHIPIRQGGTLIRLGTGRQYGWLDVYYESSGHNCAATVSTASTSGITKPMEVRLFKCSQTSPGANCTPVDRDEDAGQFKYYAGYVRVHAPNNCIYADATAGLFGAGIADASTMITNGGREASHCR